MATNLTSTPPQRERVKSWIHTILNPLIFCLRQEKALLAEGNLTWRSFSKHCELLRPIEHYLKPSYLPNYDDFCMDPVNAAFLPEFRKHDSALSQVEDAATAFFNGLICSDRFLREVRASVEEYKATARSAPQYPGLDPEEGVPHYVAEYLINRADFLPSHYTMHKFWEDYGRRFRSSIDEFEGYLERPAFRKMQQDANAFKEQSESLLLRLEKHRHSLAASYDVPYAPTPRE